MAEPIGRGWLRRLVTLGLGLAVAGLAAAPVDAAPLWWAPAPALGRPISQMASDTGSRTLAISRGVAGWLDPTSGSFLPVEGGAGAAFVAAHGADGLVLYGSGRLVETTAGGPTRLLQRLPGRPGGLGMGPGRRPMVAAVTSSGLFWGYLGSPLSHRAATFRVTAPGAMAAPVRPGQPFVVVTAKGVLLLLPDGKVQISAGAPRLGSHPSVVELSDGVLLAGDRTGLVWGLYRGGWQPVFQLLPYGGLGGVPALTAMISDGPTAAYLATAGFGTLLTPDGGYTWYRAAPPVADVVALATLGPVFSAKPSGLVVAATPAGLFLHRLQALPAPPAYSGAGLEQQLLGTIWVTVGAAALVTLLMWWPRRRRRGRLSV